MQAPHYRKIELQSPADFSYLYANAVALARRKLDLHLPPSANNDDNEPDPLRERVRELVDEFLTRTFSAAAYSISINGMDPTTSTSTTSSSNKSSDKTPFSLLTQPQETIEYEPYDTALAARVTALYAQLESLTTTVAQLRREAPKKAARMYADALRKAIEEDEEAFADPELDLDPDEEDGDGKEEEDVEMADADKRQSQPKTEDGTGTESTTTRQRQRRGRGRRRQRQIKPAWKLDIPLGSSSSPHEAERWRSGEMGEVYSDALRTLLRLQGLSADGDKSDASKGTQEAEGEEGETKALATTVGKTERAGRAAEVVEKM